MDTQTELLGELAWLRRVARALVADDSAAADLTQDVALELLLRPPGLGGKRLRGWLWTVARRKATRAKAATAPRTAAEHAVAKAESSNAFERSAARLTLHRELLAEIENLDSADADLLVRRFLHEETPQTIATELGVDPALLRKRLSRALDRLRKRLVASDRGADTWAIALVALVDKPARMAGTAATATQVGSGVSKFVSAAAAFLCAVAAVSAYLMATGKPQPVDVGVAPRVVRAGDQAGLDAPERNDESLAQREAALSEPGGPSGPPAYAREESVLYTIRFVDEEGISIEDVHALWEREDATTLVLSPDARGVASLPREARGWLYAGASGFETREIAIQWRGQSMEAVLRRSRVIPGRLLIDGVSPGRRVTLWRERYTSGHWPSHAYSDERLQQVLTREGLDWPRDPVETDIDGHFQFVTRTHWFDYFLCLPSDLELESVVGCTTIGDGIPLVHFSRTTPSLRLNAASRLAIHGQLVWSDDSSPVSAALTVWPQSGGNQVGQDMLLITDAGGHFRLPAAAPPVHDDAEPRPYNAFVIEFERTIIHVDVPQPGEAHDVGVIPIPRGAPATIRLVRRTATGSEPIEGIVVSSDEALKTDGGQATIRARPDSVIRAIAVGCAYQEVAIHPSAFIPGTAQTIQLQPATRLEIVSPLSTRTGFDPDRSLRVVLRFDASPFSGFAKSEEAQFGFRDLQKTLLGARFVAWLRPRPLDDVDGLAIFKGLPDEPLWIDGLAPGTRFTVELQDMFRSVLASQSVVMPTDVATPLYRVEFPDVYESCAGYLTGTCRWPDTNLPFTDPLQLCHDGSVLHHRPDVEGRFAIGPLAPGRYRTLAREDSSTMGPAEGTAVDIVIGANEIVLDAVYR